MNVIKRDGTIQEWDFNKIVAAVTKAFRAVGQDINDKFIEHLELEFNPYVKRSNDLTVEQIHDIVRNLFIKKNKFEVVDGFIRWRKEREEIRESKSELISEISKKLYAKNIENQNANVDEASFGGRIGEAARVVTKNAALKMMSKKSRRNHENNEIYIHDLDSYAAGMHNCLTEPMDHLLANGFSTRQTDVRAASSVNTAMQLVAVLFQLQSLQQFGGVSASHLDWTMVPYVRKSFRKHYINSWIKQCPEFYEIDILGLNYHEFNKLVEKLVTDFYFTTNIKDDDFRFDSNILDEKLKQRALFSTKKETYQAVEGLYHNLNTLQSRSGNQLPFSSINYGTCTELEGRMVIKALLEVSIEGLGKYGLTSIFPCGIFQYKKGVNDKPGTPNYDLYRLALKSTAQRIYPNYANCDWSNNTEWLKEDRRGKQEYIDSLSAEETSKVIKALTLDNDIARLLGLYVEDNKVVVDLTERPIEYFSTMGCRTANGLDVNALPVFKSNIECLINNTLENINPYFSGAQKDGRGNICPVTIIMPTLAMQSIETSLKTVSATDPQYKETCINNFMKLLNKKIGEAKDTLIERFNHIASQPVEAARFMYENNTMSGYVKEEGIISALKHGTIVIGQLGLAETLQILIGCNHTTSEGMELAKRIEQLFKDKCNEFKKEYHLNFGVYYTPAENLCYTAMKKFRQKYGIIPNVSDREYFTNSMHVPVWEKVNVFEKIDIESQLTGYSSAGCITYVELPSSAKNNIDALEKIINYMMDKDIPYAAINVPIDTCDNCNYTDEIGEVCPKCGGTHIKRLRRVTGYLTGDYLTAFNRGKQKEVEDRVKHG
jgi:ribonucleoside-triphosphate reductase